MLKKIISTAACFFAGLILVAKSSFAGGVFLDSTRIILPLSQKETSVEITNTNDYPVLVQTWLDEGDINQDLETFEPPVVILPPLVKLNPRESRYIRLLLVRQPENKNQETVLWFNSREISPEAQDDTSNMVNFTVTNRVKLFLRPEQLIKNGSDNWVNRLSCKTEPQSTKKQVTCYNPTDYFASISHVFSNDTDGYYHSEGMMLSPKGKHTFTLQKKNGTSKNKGLWISVVGDDGYHIDKLMK